MQCRSWAETVWVTRVRADALAGADTHQHFCLPLLLRNYDVKGVGKSVSCLGVTGGEYGGLADLNNH